MYTAGGPEDKQSTTHIRQDRALDNYKVTEKIVV